MNLERESALAQICAVLSEMRVSDPALEAKLSDQALRRYESFCRQGPEQLACPVCFLTKGRISSLLYPRPPQIFPQTRHLICEFCTTSFPLGAEAEGLPTPAANHINSMGKSGTLM